MIHGLMDVLAGLWELLWPALVAALFVAKLDWICDRLGSAGISSARQVCERLMLPLLFIAAGLLAISTRLHVRDRIREWLAWAVLGLLILYVWPRSAPLRDRLLKACGQRTTPIVIVSFLRPLRLRVAAPLNQALQTAVASLRVTTEIVYHLAIALLVVLFLAGVSPSTVKEALTAGASQVTQVPGQARERIHHLLFPAEALASDESGGASTGLVIRPKSSPTPEARVSRAALPHPAGRSANTGKPDGQSGVGYALSESPAASSSFSSHAAQPKPTLPTSSSPNKGDSPNEARTVTPTLTPIRTTTLAGVNSPTATATVSPTESPTASLTVTAAATAATPSVSATMSPSVTPSATTSPTSPSTATGTPPTTATITFTPTQSIGGSATPMGTPSGTPVSTATASPTTTQTARESFTATASATLTKSPTPFPRATPTPAP